MNLSRRERWIAVAALAVLGLLVLDAWLLTPLTDAYREDLALREQLTGQARRDEILYRRRDRINAAWSERQAAGLSLSAADAENRLLGALEQWSSQSSMTITAIRSQRQTPSDGLRTIRCHLKASATMDSLTRFLWLVHATDQPVAIGEIKITCADDTKADLSVEMDVYTLCLEAGEQPS